MGYMEKLEKAEYLLKPSFEHQPSIDSFFVKEDFKLFKEINLWVYKELTTCVKELGINEKGTYWEPVNFFNLLYDQITIVSQYRHQPSKVIEHLRTINLEKGIRLLLLRYLSGWRVFFHYHKGEIVDLPAGSLVSDHCIDVCSKLIEEESIEFFTINSLQVPEDFSSFELTREAWSHYPSPDERIHLCIKSINEVRQTMAGTSNEEVKENCEEFIKKCESEIETIKRLKAEGFYGKEFVTNDAPKSPPPRKKRIDEDPLFNELFKPPKFGGTLNERLQQKLEIAPEDNNKWRGDPARIKGLVHALIKKHKEDSVLLYVTTPAKIGRALCREYGIDYNLIKDWKGRDGLTDYYYKILKGI
jgi:hypothetical protein